MTNHYSKAVEFLGVLIIVIALLILMLPGVVWGAIVHSSDVALAFCVGFIWSLICAFVLNKLVKHVKRGENNEGCNQ